ncbi:MAG: hypothetical protein AAF183_13010 [Pseudomonadota bacterium]
MGTPLLGENLLAQIEISSALTTIACQGDLTLQTGRTLEISRTKNCNHPFYRNAGYTASFTIELEVPMHATHTALRNADQAQAPVNIALVSAITGAPTWTGPGYVVLQQLTFPTEGPATWEVGFAWVDDPTYALVA